MNAGVLPIAARLAQYGGKIPMKKTLALAISLLAFFASPAMAEPTRLVVLGDSLSAGYGLGPGEGRDGPGADHGGQAALRALVGVALEGAAGGAGEGGVVGPRELIQDVRRDDGAEDGLEAPGGRHVPHHRTA